MPAWRAFMTTELVPAIDTALRTLPGTRTPGDLRQLARRLRRRRPGGRVTPGSSGCAPRSRRRRRPRTLLTNQAQGQRAVHGVRFFVLGAVYDTDVKGARTLANRARRSDAPT